MYLFLAPVRPFETAEQPMAGLGVHLWPTSPSDHDLSYLNLEGNLNLDQGATGHSRSGTLKRFVSFSVQ